MSGTQIAEAVTDDTGTVIFTDIPAGEYFFREISAPGMYVADDTQHNFVVSTDEELSFDIYNTRKVGSIAVLKQGTGRTHTASRSAVRGRAGRFRQL